MPFVYNFSDSAQILISMDKNLKLRPIAHRDDTTSVQISKPGDVVLRFRTTQDREFIPTAIGCIRQVQLDRVGGLTHSTRSVSDEYAERLFDTHPWLLGFVTKVLEGDMDWSCPSLPLEHFPLKHDIQYGKQKKILGAFFKRHGITDIDPTWFMEQYPRPFSDYQLAVDWASLFPCIPPNKIRECMGYHNGTSGEYTGHLAWYGIPKGTYPKAVHLNFTPIVRFLTAEGKLDFTPGSTGIPDCEKYSHFIRLHWRVLHQSNDKLTGVAINFLKNPTME